MRSRVIAACRTNGPHDADCMRLLTQEFACNGTLVDDEEAGQVIQLQGDQRLKIQSFLTEEGIAARNTIKVHGF